MGRAGIARTFPRQVDRRKWAGTLVCFFLHGPKLAYRVETREGRLPADAVVSFSIDVQGLRTGINRDMAKLHRM
jgi:hypothetical protein